MYFKPIIIPFIVIFIKSGNNQLLFSGGVSGENEVFNVSKSMTYVLSGTSYGIEKSFLVVEIWISEVGWFRLLSENV